LDNEEEEKVILTNIISNKISPFEEIEENEQPSEEEIKGK
jgi:hypothetical protein